jgi:hypothetical protein
MVCYKDSFTFGHTHTYLCIYVIRKNERMKERQVERDRGKKDLRKEVVCV